MVGVAQLGRAPDCGSGGRGFESLHPPHFRINNRLRANFQGNVGKPVPPQARTPHQRIDERKKGCECLMFASGTLDGMARRQSTRQWERSQPRPSRSNGMLPKVQRSRKAIAGASGNYYLAFLNAPSATGAWMMQFGGHHYAANISFDQGDIVATTPRFYESSQPASG